ncbi:S-fimbrial protein subunit SfaA precursor [compost metagenome]
MKYFTIASATAAALALASSAHAASTTGGTITFTGVVNDATCTVSGGSGTDGGTGNFSVALDPVNANLLGAAGNTANPKVFDVIIGGPGQGTCEDGKIASMSFLPSSTQVDPVTGALRNVLTGEATNVQIELADDAAQAINLAVPGQSWDATIGSVAPNTGKVQFQAHYLAVNGASTPGLVNTNVVYSVVYN